MADTDPLNTTTSRTCALCSSQAKYTCPRCRAPTCSLPCSRKHKQHTGCPGERNKAEYVPMNAYGWGTMMRDYSFLEEVGRKASEWGNEIVRGRYQAERGKSSRIDSLGKTKVRGKRTKGTKRDTLKSYLESVDIDIGLLPNGMERRGLSQSTWDPKLRRPLLTIEFKFYPPSSPTAEVVRTQPHTVIAHRNPISKTLLDILRCHIPQQPLQSRKHREHSLPDWVPPLVHPHLEDPESFAHPDCYVRASLDLHYQPTSQAEFYHKLDPTSPLLELLRNTHFVEFPTIHIFDRDASSFRGTVVDKTGRITRHRQDEAYGKAPKRRKTNAQAIAGLLGDYGSSSESEKDQTRKKDGLLMLGNYSENEVMEATSGVRLSHDDDETGSPEESSSSDAEETPIKPEMLLELMKRARQAADEDIDWGDESPEDEGLPQ
ncbi:hypothetical protein F5141DRAFT_1124178 [Pisolithus sp. B1]|nr:hypothetical protein F5141DRAFT_1124178 [Pisolithus sp. B1]